MIAPVFVRFCLSGLTEILDIFAIETAQGPCSLFSFFVGDKACTKLANCADPTTSHRHDVIEYDRPQIQADRTSGTAAAPHGALAVSDIPTFDLLDQPSGSHPR